MLTLYQFAISHYCEKVRWALAFKGIEHRVVNLIPGLHRIRASRLGLRRASLPVVAHRGRLLQGSRAILDYLDQAFPARALTPRHEPQRGEALDWETFADQQVGPHVRRLCYQSLLEHRAVAVPLLASGAPWYAVPLLHLAFAPLRRTMRAGLDLDDDHAEHSRQVLDAAVSRLADAYSQREYLVAGGFSRADLAAAALLAPLCRPAGYGLRWPPRMPPALEALGARHARRLEWVSRLYREHRDAGDGEAPGAPALPIHP